MFGYKEVGSSDNVVMHSIDWQVKILSVKVGTVSRFTLHEII